MDTTQKGHTQSSKRAAAAGRQVQVRCQGSNDQKKALSQQTKDRLIIAGTSEFPDTPMTCSCNTLVLMKVCNNTRASAACMHSSIVPVSMEMRKPAGAGPSECLYER